MGFDNWDVEGRRVVDVQEFLCYFFERLDLGFLLGHSP